VFRRQADDAFSLFKEQRIVDDDERPVMLSRRHRERLVDPPGPPRFNNTKGQLQCAGSTLQLLQGLSRQGIRRIRQGGHTSDSGNRLLEEVEPFRVQFEGQEVDAREVPTRPVEAGHEPGPDRVAHEL
jgi:hypothetical protein